MRIPGAFFSRSNPSFAVDVGFMLESPASVTSMPRTLAEAKTEIARLRQQLGHGPPAGKPIPKAPEDPHPILPGRNPPINPGAVVVDLSNMAPVAFDDFVARCGNKELKILLSRETAKRGKEQDEHVVGRLYRELKKRGA